jgi:hypothetical protein
VQIASNQAYQSVFDRALPFSTQIPQIDSIKRIFASLFFALLLLCARSTIQFIRRCVTNNCRFAYKVTKWRPKNNQHRRHKRCLTTEFGAKGLTTVFRRLCSSSRFRKQSSRRHLSGKTSLISSTSIHCSLLLFGYLTQITFSLSLSIY